MKNMEPVHLHYLKNSSFQEQIVHRKFCFSMSKKLIIYLFTFFADSEKRTPLFPIIPTG